MHRRTANLDIESQFDTPTYKQLVGGLLKTIKISYADVSLEEKKEFLCDAVIAEALVPMAG